LKASVINYANAAAQQFDVQFVVAQPGRDEVILETQTVARGLGVGASIDLTVTVTPSVAGPWKLIARVDPTDQIAESDETDNQTVLEINVEQSEGNLTLPADGLTVSSAGNPGGAPAGYLFTISLTNTGQTRMTGPMSVRYFGITPAGADVEWGTFDFEIDLAPGDPFNQEVSWTVDPGTYRAYALADSGGGWAESNEDDNEAFFDFTAP